MESKTIMPDLAGVNNQKSNNFVHIIYLKFECIIGVTPPTVKILRVKNVGAFLVCGTLMKLLRKYILKIWKKKCGNYMINSRDGFELEFSGSSESELWRFRAEPSWGTFIFELKPSWQFWQYVCMSKSLNFFKLIFPRILLSDFASITWFQ